MANFKTHALVGIGVGIIGLFSFSLAVQFISVFGAVISVFLAAVASVLPNIDNDISYSRQFALSALEILFPIIFTITFADEFSLEILLLTGILIFFLIRYLLGWLVAVLTEHRGAWHSIPMAFIASMVIFFLFFCWDLPSRIVFSSIFFVSFLFHLILDEICSLKCFNSETNEGFGTALKFTGSTRRQTIFMYLIIMLLAGICFFEQIIDIM